MAWERGGEVGLELYQRRWQQGRQRLQASGFFLWTAEAEDEAAKPQGDGFLSSRLLGPQASSEPSERWGGGQQGMVR
jgi:hypothetical protein